MKENWFNRGISTPLFQSDAFSAITEKHFKKFSAELAKNLSGVSAQYEKFLKGLVKVKFNNLDVERTWVSVQQSRTLGTDDNLDCILLKVFAQDCNGRVQVCSIWIYQCPDGLSGYTSDPDYCSLTEATTDDFHHTFFGQVRICNLASLNLITGISVTKAVRWLLRYRSFIKTSNSPHIIAGKPKNLQLWHKNVGLLVNALYNARLFKFAMGSPLNHFSRILSPLGVYVNGSISRSRYNLAKVFLSETRLKIEDSPIKDEQDVNGGDYNGK